MKKMLSLILAVFSIFVLAFTLMGCQRETEQSTVLETADFSFPVPEGYTIVDASETQCTICKDETVVGGIVMTDLNNGSIKDIDKTELRKYLDIFAPAPLIYEYMAMYFSDNSYDYISINFKVTDTGTMDENYYHHYLFEKSSSCYDLWLSDDLVSEDEQKEILTSIAQP